MEPASPPRLHDLADALGAVRAEIRALKAREAALRAALIAARPNGPVTGRHYEVVLRETTRRVFDRDALPKAILGDHRFWMTRRAQSVVTRECAPEAASTAPRPISRADRRDVGRDLFGDETDLVLFEEF